jgi:hypothetical protein
MVARCDKHLKPHPEYQYKNQLKPLAKLNPLETVAPNLLGQLVDVCLDVMAVVVVMADQE